MTEPKPPPHSIEAEQSLLGAILINNQAFHLVSELQAEHFFEPIHSQLFQVMRILHTAGKVVTPISLIPLMPAGLMIAGAPIKSYVSHLAAEATTVINAPDFAGTIRTLALMREMIRVGRDIEDRFGTGILPDQITRDGFAQIDELRGRFMADAGRKTRSDMDKTIAATVERMALLYQGGTAHPSVRTGIAQLDIATGGFRRGELVVCAGRPGTGKSTVATSMSRSAAKAGHGIGFFSLEMPEEQLGVRLISDHMFDSMKKPIPYNLILHPKSLTAEQAEGVALAGREMMGLPIEFDFSSKLTIGEITARAKMMALSLRQKHDKHLELIVVDYLKFVTASDRYYGHRTYEVGEISAALKGLAKEMDTCVLLLAQLNREVEKKQDKRPELSFLRESGDLESDADMVLLLYRESYYLQNDPMLNKDPAIMAKLQNCFSKLEIIVAKHRMGPTGTAEVFCDMRASAVRSLQGIEPDGPPLDF